MRAPHGGGLARVPRLLWLRRGVQQIRQVLFQAGIAPDDSQRLQTRLARSATFFQIVVGLFVVTVVGSGALLGLSSQAEDLGRDQGQLELTQKAKRVILVSDTPLTSASPTVITQTTGETTVIQYQYDTWYWIGASDDVYMVFEDLRPAPACTPTKVYAIKKTAIQSIELRAAPLDQGCAPTATVPPVTLRTPTSPPISVATPTPIAPP